MSRNRKPNIKPKAKVRTKTNVEFEGSEREIPIIRTKSDDVVSMYADGLLVQNRGEMFVMSYLQTQYPLIVTIEEATDVEYVEQRCIYQVAVSAQQMARNIKATNENFKRYVSQLLPETQKVLNELAGYTEDGTKTENNGNDTTTKHN
jgi:preprotein translocase subunit Sec63